MSGKRLLDAARVYGALKSVARNHITIRSQQIDTFAKTSTIAKAVKNQTDRITVTAGAAYALAKRLSETESVRPHSSFAGPPNAGSTIPRQEHLHRSSPATGPVEGPAQDHHYERPERAGTGEEPVVDELEIQQEAPRQTTLPDGSVSPGSLRSPTPSKPFQGKDTFSERPRGNTSSDLLAEDHMGQPDLDVLQKKAKRHSLPDGTIPPESSLGEVAAKDTFTHRPFAESSKHPLDQEHQKGKEFEPKESDESTIPVPTLAEEQTQGSSDRQVPSLGAITEPHMDSADTFSERSHETAPSLPDQSQAHIPDHAETREGMHNVNQQKINQDVYYSSTPESKRDLVVEETTPEGIDLNVFHSPQVAGLIRSRGSDDRRKAYEMKMNAARQSRASAERVTSQHIEKSAIAEEEDTHNLAQTLAAEVAQQQTQEAMNEDQTLSRNQMHESKVPASRLGRIWQFGGLATSMAFGAVGETFRRVTGASSDGSIMLSEANMGRLVAKLSRMRGAALKLGQMMSFQDAKLLPPAINAVLQRVQDSADYMPPSQRDKVMTSSLGSSWKELFSSFDDVPVAAASIGQVHKAILASSGQQVAVKVQYPGVRGSIDSDLSNLSLLLTASRLLPKGLYLDKTIANARTELAWECDYKREAECGKRFMELLEDEPSVFRVPKVFEEASGAEVLTAEFMSGTGVTKIKDLSQEERDWIGTNILRLCLRELMEWRFMQTDPNWTNFLYNRKDKKLELLDFGASREYPESFVTPYVELLIAASKRDRDTCRERSIELGYLTGYESKAMLDAHVDSILTLAEPFMFDAPLDDQGRYDFRDQTITDRVRAKIGLMVKERLAPPPEETYSLHRKLSGAFLLCARLGSRIGTRDMFVDAVELWRKRETAHK